MGDSSFLCIYKQREEKNNQYILKSECDSFSKLVAIARQKNPRGDNFAKATRYDRSIGLW